MTCSDFIEGFSDYVDGAGTADFRDEADGHLGTCPDCRRYLAVFERGRDLLRSFPAVEVSDDFHPRLQHRLYHVEDGEALSLGNKGSATTAATALGMAVLLVLAAWSPVLLARDPVVELTPIVVSNPEPRPLGLRPTRATLVGSAPAVLSDAELWKSNALLFQYSSLARDARGARAGAQRLGVD